MLADVPAEVHWIYRLLCPLITQLVHYLRQIEQTVQMQVLS